MIWFDIKQLERGLKIGDISDRSILTYLLANLIMFSIVPYISSNNYTTKWMVAIEIVVTITITVVGTRKAFNINTSGDNKDFFRRFLALSFVTGIRLFVLAIIVSIPLGIVSYFFERTMGYSESLKDILRICLMAAAGIFYYYMLTSSFKRVSQ